MPADLLSATFSALADPTRRAILAQLARGGEVSVQALAKPFSMSLPAISRHLKVLERGGLIIRGRKAQWRPCTLRVNTLKKAEDWLELHRRHWEESFDRLADELKKMQAGQPASPTAQTETGGTAP